MASPRLHPNGVHTYLLLLLMSALTRSSGCAPDSKTSDKLHIKFKEIGNAEFYTNVTLYPITINIEFTPIDSSFFQKLKDFALKFDTFKTNLLVEQTKLANYVINNLQNKFATIPSPPKLTQSLNHHFKEIDREYFSSKLKSAAQEPLKALMKMTVPATEAKAGEILNSFLNELNLLSNLVDEEIKAYSRCLYGKLNHEDIRPIWGGNFNSTLEKYDKIGIEFLNLQYKNKYQANYNIYLLTQPIKIPHIRPIIPGNFQLKFPSFFLYEGKGVIFKPFLPKNILTLQVVYTTLEINDLLNSANLHKYLSIANESFIKSQDGKISLNPSASDSLSLFEKGSLSDKFKATAGNFTFNMGKNFLKFILKKSGLNFLSKSNFTDEDILNESMSIFDYLPEYWQYYLGLTIAIILSIGIIIYILFSRARKRKLKVLEKKDMSTFALMSKNSDPTKKIAYE